MYDIAILGHIVIDEIKRGSFQARSVGGAATYSTLAAKTYGAKALLVSKIGKDFPENLLSFLIKREVDLTCVKQVSAPTTKFKLIYENGERTLFLMDRCEPILPDDLCKPCLNAKTFHIGSVINEIPLSTLRKIYSKNKYISLDVQGYIRKIDKTGKVFLSEWNEAERFLKFVNVVHADIYEAKVITKTDVPSKAAEILVEMGADIALVTLGEKGSYIGTREGVFYAPTIKPSKLIDSTGAGDVYTVIFTLEYQVSHDVKWAVAAATAAASFVVEFPGPTGFPGKHMIYKRARSLLNHIKRVI